MNKTQETLLPDRVSSDGVQESLSALHELEFHEETSAPQRKGRWFSLVLIFTLILVSLLIALNLITQNTPVKVRVNSIRSNSGMAPAVAELEVSGYVVAPESATVSSSVTGRVTSVLVELGDHVTKSQAVATLDDRQAKIVLEINRIELQSQLALKQAYREDLALSQVSSGRIKRLWKDHLVSAESYELALSQVIPKQIALTQVEKTINSLNFQIKLKQQQLEDLVIRAPFNGTVTELSANVGEIISPASGGTHTRSGICTITDMRVIEFHFDVNERFLSKVLQSKKIEVTFVSQPNKIVEAKIKQIAPTTDSQTGTAVVIVTPTTPVTGINPGVTATGFFYSESDSLVKNSLPNVIIPANAIHLRNGKNFIFTAQNNIAKEHVVQGKYQKDGSFLLSDVNVDWSSVINWAESPLSDGQTIQSE